jgi:hypothetical protein
MPKAEVLNAKIQKISVSAGLNFSAHGSHSEKRILHG